MRTLTMVDFETITNNNDHIVAKNFNPIQGKKTEWVEYTDPNEIFFDHNLLEEVTVNEALDLGYKFYVIFDDDVERKEVRSRSIYDGYYGCDGVDPKRSIYILREGAQPKLLKIQEEDWRFDPAMEEWWDEEWDDE